MHDLFAGLGIREVCNARFYVQIFPAQAQDFATAHPHAAGILLDAHVDGYGGGGKAFDWSLIPAHVPRPVVLSGGLHTANVIDGITQVRPWAVDVSSGVEVAKGLKDAALMRQFCEAVREADARIADADS